jgi:hypothetical protein
MTTLKAQREARIAAKLAAKAAAEAAEIARIKANPIYAAIAPQRQATVAQAVVFTRENLLKFAAQFPVGADLKDHAPRGDSWKDGREQYKTKQARHYLALQVLHISRANSFMDCPQIIAGVNAEGIERLCDEAAKDAAFSFDEYVAKLTRKVGHCNRASVEGWLWDHSILTVVKRSNPDDAVSPMVTERWKTQQILNFSVYGKAFNQWPTRKVA